MAFLSCYDVTMFMSLATFEEYGCSCCHVTKVRWLANGSGIMLLILSLWQHPATGHGVTFSVLCTCCFNLVVEKPVVF